MVRVSVSLKNTSKNPVVRDETQGARNATTIPVERTGWAEDIVQYCTLPEKPVFRDTFKE